MKAVEGWENEFLGRVAHLTMGQSPDSKYYSEEENGLPFLQGCAEFGARFPKHKMYCSQTKKIAHAGAILFSVRAPVGKINIADRDYIIGRGLAAISGIDVDQSYLEQYLIFKEQSFQNASQGSTFAAINSAELKGWPIDYPTSKPEQTKIAEILSTVDRAIEQTEALIAKQQRIKTGLMQDILTRGIDEHGNLRSEQTHQFKDSPLGRIPVEWEVASLNSRASVKGGKRLPIGHVYDEGDTKYRYLQTTDFISKALVYGTLHYLSAKTFRVLERYEITDGEVFISIAGVNLGVAGVFRPTFDDRTILTENAARIHILTDTLPEYLALQLNGLTVQRQILEDKGIGAGVPKLALFRIQQFIIPWPSQEEQLQIVRLFQFFDVSVQKHKEKLKKMRSLKTALMQDLLTGKKRVTELLSDIKAVKYDDPKHFGGSRR